MGLVAASARGSAGQTGEMAAGPLIPLSCVRESVAVRPSARTAQVQLRFGLSGGGQTVSIAEGVNVRLGPGRIILLTGPSGSGKSSALSAIAAHQCLPPCQGGMRATNAGARKGGQLEADCFPHQSCVNISQVGFGSDCAIIDQIAPHGELADAASILTACGLGEPGLWLRSFEALSDGEKFRARLARAISLSRAHFDAPFAGPLLCDEFCSGLHRRAAKAIAHNLRKLVTRRGLCMVLACSANDLTADLDPDCVVTFSPGGVCDVEERTPIVSPVPSFRRRVHIEPGTKGDYDSFASMHYRGTDELGFVDRIFVLREGESGDLLGIVVYSHAALELALRNQATKGWFSKNPQRVNRHLRVLRRLVIHPDVRGCGLGHYLVRKTMSRLGVAYVECLAAMGEFNPVFERAGMARIGQYDAPSGPRTALQALRLMDIDPHSAQFAMDVARKPSVRAVVAGAVADWYAATTAGKEYRVERQSPDFLARTFRGLVGVQPVYYLWRRGQRMQRKRKRQFEPI